MGQKQKCLIKNEYTNDAKAICTINNPKTVSFDNRGENR